MINPKSEIQISKQARITQIKNPERMTPIVLTFDNSDFEFVSDFDIRAWNFAPARRRGGFVLPLVLIAMVILISLAFGEMMASFNSRMQAIQTRSQTEAMLAAEAGYEKAIFWMSRQKDILGALQDGTSGSSGNIDFGSSSCRYQVSFLDFIGARPVFRVACIGTSGKPVFGRSVDVTVMQETTGWAMGTCQIPTGPTTMDSVYFIGGEVIETPVHINDQHDSPDKIDIHISGSPRFRDKVEMGESRKAGSNDKYKSVISCFAGGIYFDQPYVRITDEAAVQSKINRFRDSTATAYKFTPADSNSISAPKGPVVQLEFFVEGGVGKVRITNNCVYKGYQQASDDRTWNYRIVPGSNPPTFQRYPIYAYHYKPNTEASIVVPVEDTYVTQHFGAVESAPGGQIFVNGNVVIGSKDYNDMVVKSKITVVVTGNIWIADSIKVDGPHDLNGMPTAENPNVLGLIAKGVVKVVDPGMSGYGTGSPNNYPGPPATISGFTYIPVCNSDGATSYNRKLPDPTIVEAAITCGGGGWGAENVMRKSGGTEYGGRKENSSPQDTLIVCGSISEAIRGVVGLSGKDGYVKNYYVDTRLMNGILPGDIWFSGKYIPAPAGWSDSRTAIH
jgi:hypothetical protein